MKVKLVSTVRDVDEQDQLYAKGRTKPGGIVTWVQGGDSWHNYGLAFDLAVTFPDGKVDWGSKLYDTIGEQIATTYPDVLWGGHFPEYYGGDFIDRPHYEFHMGATSVRDLPFGPIYPDGQCTAFVAAQERAILGTEHLTFKKYPGLPDRDGAVWDQLAKDAGIPTGATPKVNSVAQWKGGHYGHVAWVSAVHADGSFDVREANFRLDGKEGTRSNLSAAGVTFIYPESHNP